jgi:hypothetical protein
VPVLIGGQGRAEEEVIASRSAAADERNQDDAARLLVQL